VHHHQRFPEVRQRATDLLRPDIVEKLLLDAKAPAAMSTWASPSLSIFATESLSNPST